MATPVNNDVRKWLTQDVIASILLLILCLVLWVASLQIREPDYGQLSPATWPRIVIGVLTLLCLIYLIQSIRQITRSQSFASSTEHTSLLAEKENEQQSPSPIQLRDFYRYWKNVFWCFTLFGLYLWSLPWLGMLVGACLFVFLLLTALGGWKPKQILLHALIALVTVGGMWSLFTYGLGVLLPAGSLFDFR